MLEANVLSLPPKAGQAFLFAALYAFDDPLEILRILEKNGFNPVLKYFCPTNQVNKGIIAVLEAKQSNEGESLDIGEMREHHAQLWELFPDFKDSFHLAYKAE
jgi:hypothetical protein